MYGDASEKNNELVKSLDVHESAHRDTIMKVTHKMQLFRQIYYS